MLLGVNKPATLGGIRLIVGSRIATDLKPRHLYKFVTQTIDFDALPGAFQSYLDGTVTGRTVVKIGK